MVRRFRRHHDARASIGRSLDTGAQNRPEVRHNDVVRPRGVHVGYHLIAF